MNSSNDEANWQIIHSGKYLSLSTRKKSGQFVATPVWFAPLDDAFVVFSAGKVGKVKRLKNFSESQIAACTMTGELTGPWLATSAFILDDPADEAMALTALRKKYGWLMWTLDFFAALVGKKKKRAYIRIERRQ